MREKYFGTDGIRGRSNANVINPEMMVKLAMAISVAHGLNNKGATVIIGKDTRLSGYMLEFALTSGFISMGVNVVLVGPVPTPAVSMLVRSLRADLGIMISASHNPYYDNGVKLFNSQGYKITEEDEQKIERLIDSDMSPHLAPYDGLGKATQLKDVKGRYIEKLKSHFPQHLKLDGVKIVVDCANGAAYDIAPKVFRELGAEVITHAVSPNGFNINQDCGVLAPNTLAKLVVENKADIGIALDGDADRILITDENGNVIDGDQIIALIAKNHFENMDGNNSHAVATILSNMRLETYLQEHGIELVRTIVGDKHVVGKMRELGVSVGGEASGHIIVGEDAATGDGIKVALEILGIYLEKNNKTKSHNPISKILNLFDPLPQYSHNISYDYKLFGQDFINRQDFKEIASKYENRNEGKARIILRQSGTEPVIRLMIESADEKLAENIISEMSSEIGLIV